MKNADDKQTDKMTDTALLSTEECQELASGQGLARVRSAPPFCAKFKQRPEDFTVTEELPEALFTTGEHQLLLVEKSGQNTQYIARRLANHAGVREVDVGFCGLKDRQSVSQQWFSIYYGKRPRRQPETFSIEGVRIKKVGSCAKKLRRGEHKCNHFKIRLRECQVSQTEIEARLRQIKDTPLPNYFGPQRFGNDGSNLAAAQSVFLNERRVQVKRHGRDFSAARSLLFNQLVDARIRYRLDNGLPLNWSINHQEASGQVDDVCLFGEPVEEHGRSDLSESLQRQIGERFPVFAKGLRDYRINMAFRKEFFTPANFSWRWGVINPHQDDTMRGDLELSFTLTPGCFATSVLREIVKLI